MHVTKVAMVVDASFVIFFLVALLKREVRRNVGKLFKKCCDPFY